MITEFEVRCEGKLLFTEKQRIDADEIKRASGLRNHPVIGTMLVYSDSLNRELLDSLRKLTMLDGISGITQPIQNLLVVRYMGSSTVDVNDYFIKCLELLRPAILQRKICRPRIWAT